MEAAIEVFARSGLRGTRSETVAEAAGVAHGTVFLHYSSMDELLSQAIETVGDRILARLHEIASRGSTVEELLAAHIEGLRCNEAFYSRLVAESGLLPPSARSTLVLLQSALAFHLASAFDAGQSSRELRPMPLHLFLNGWLGLVHYYLSNAELFAPGASVLERKGAELVAHYSSLAKRRIEA